MGRGLVSTSERELRQRVAEACWILFSEGHEHYFLGHVSAREPGGSLIIVKPSGIGLGEVKAEDLAVMDLSGKQLAGDRPIHQEMPIHTEIYRRRPDVNCVVHTHPFFVSAFAAASADFQMVSQDSVLFVDGFGYYPSAKLVTTPEQGRELAASLGSKSVVVLKNHGLAAVGPSVAEATFLATSFDRSLRLQLAASQLGPIDPISPAEAAEMRAHFATSYDGRVQAMWGYLLRKAMTRQD